MGGSGGHSKSDNESSFNQFVDPNQAPFLQGLYSNAQQMFQNQNYAPTQQMFGNIGQMMQNSMGMVNDPLQNQMGGGFRDPALEASLRDSMANPSQMGRMYESILGGSGNTYADPLKQRLMDNTMLGLERGGLKDTQTQFANLGRAGSDKHAVENALMKSEAIRNANDQAAAIDYNTFDKDLGWKMGIAQQADLGRGQAQDRAMSLLGQKNQAQMGGLNYMPGLQGLQMGLMQPYMGSYNLPWNALAQYANVIGAPTVLGTGTSSGSSFGMQGGGGLYG